MVMKKKIGGYLPIKEFMQELNKTCYNRDNKVK